MAEGIVFIVGTGQVGESGPLAASVSRQDRRRTAGRGGTAGSRRGARVEAVAFDLWLRFDPTVLRPVLVELGQAASTFTLTPNLADEGLARIGLFNAYSFQGSGEIAVITFQVIGRVGDLTPLALTAAVDEGRIPSIVKEGRVRVRPGR